MDQSFKKEERLCGKKSIDDVYHHGAPIKSYPIVVLWKKYEIKSKYPAQLCIIVPKKNLKKAVSRNLVKRRIREAYRTNKKILYSALSGKDITLRLIIIYTSREILLYREIESKIILSLQRLIGENEKNT